MEDEESSGKAEGRSAMAACSAAGRNCASIQLSRRPVFREKKQLRIMSYALQSRAEMFPGLAIQQLCLLSRT